MTHGPDPAHRAERIAWLEREVAFHNRRYYDFDQPLISDPEYDAIRRELETLKPDSPVLQDIGHAAFGEKYRHPVMMGSLQKCHSAAEIVKKFGGTELLAMPKIDGCSLSLHYEKGSLVRAVTRGDGIEGELVTANARFVRDIPVEIAPGGAMEVRGEAYIAKSDFYGKMDAAGAGDEGMANPRNATAGGLRQKDPALTRDRKIRFVGYEIIGRPDLATHADKIALLKAAGFVTPPVEVGTFADAAALGGNLARWREEFETLPYEIDGVVFRVNNQAAFESEGWTGKCPKGALAFKFETEKKAARITGFEWATSRNGRVCPVAVIEPTLICGSTVSRITLHNLEWMQQQDVAVGDLVRFEKANEIIPKLVEVLERPAGRRVEYPEKCPSCAAALIRESVDLVCQNPDCPAQFEETVIHLLDELGVKGVAGATLERVVKAGLVRHPWEILDVKQEALTAIGFGPKQAENIETALRTPRVGPAQMLSALGIPGWGRRFFDILLDSGACSLDDLLNGGLPDAAKVAEVFSLGEKRAEALLAGLRDKAAFLQGLRPRVDLVLPPPKPVAGAAGASPLAGKSFCVTGTLSRPREEIQDRIRALGGLVRDAVSGRLDYLVAGEHAGSKLAKAQTLGVKVLAEAEFETLCSGAAVPPESAPPPQGVKDAGAAQPELF